MGMKIGKIEHKIEIAYNWIKRGPYILSKQTVTWTKNDLREEDPKPYFIEDTRPHHKHNDKRNCGTN